LVPIELHTHLEGSVTPSRLRALAQHYGQPGAAHSCLTADGLAYRRTDFSGFLQIFKQVTQLLRSPADFHRVALDFGAQLAADGVLYCEAAVSYGVLLHRGIDPRPVQRALCEAAAQIEAEHGVVVRWIADAVRQWGPDAAWRAGEAALYGGRALGVVGFGLGGDEAAAPPDPFAPLFATVAAEGLGVTIHAGEASGPDSVRAAVEVCGAHRIGHGTAAAGDRRLLAMLAERGVCVELCPGSNLATGIVATDADYPLRAFLDADVPCCLNSDDRAVFGLDLRREYRWAATQHGLTTSQARRMAHAALAAVFDPAAAEPVRAAVSGSGHGADCAD
jgi:adenosine deaminase